MPTHLEIVKAIAGRDPDRAEAAARIHYAETTSPAEY
jgi:DNA-binding GntR family transcriptional regulator